MSHDFIHVPESEFAVAELEFDDDALWIAEGELAADQAKWTYPRCPNPTKWRLTKTPAKFRGKMQPVSAAVTAKLAPITYTFRVQRSIMWSASVTSGMKVGIPGLEAETGITLSASITLTAGESVRYVIPKGKTVALFGGCGFYLREFSRTVYGSAMCNPVVQTTTVASPYMKYLEPNYV